ncbi:hypothetical protein BDC45DRAFT_608263 [Circinella umbellata]|nr:hypothetical protein BDC45DRAFT_608263 [Circinella umbellata]
MTYITYTKRQYSDCKKEKEIYSLRPLENQKPGDNCKEENIHKYDEPPKKIPYILPKPSFMPSCLVRTSDMKPVKGSEVQEGYCALSYSWNQSGEITKNETTGDMERNDEGKHKIIYSSKTVLRTILKSRDRIPGKVKFVKFEELIQEICKDFNIKYIWYDQMCIDQTNDEEKRDQIRQMHHIYRNAYCTIALVPELTVKYSGFLSNIAHTDYISLVEAQWMKRMWTLEEAIMSSKIIFIGEETHCWYHQLPSLWFPIFRKGFFPFDICTILHYAHRRTSSKKHDHVFALANIFPGVMDKIEIDYNQDIQTLMIRFYGLLAKQDICILCFGRSDRYKTMFRTRRSVSTQYCDKSNIKVDIPIQKFNLPSWTGAHGEHKYWAIYKTSFRNYTVNENVLQVTCAGMTNGQREIINLNLDNIIIKIPPFPQEDRRPFWRLVIRLQPQGSTNEKLINVWRIEGLKPDTKDHINIMKNLNNLSHFMSIKKENLLWSTTCTTSFSFHGLTEPLGKSARCVLLAGVPFKRRGVIWLNFTYYPILKKNGDYYKAIGMCRVEDRDEHHNFFDGIPLQKQTFKIH